MADGESRGDPNCFESVLTFAPDDAATRIEMRTVFPTKELRDEAVEKVSRDRGRPADPEQPGCLRHRDRSEGSCGLMAGKVFFSVSMSLDRFIAPESIEELMGQQWMELQRWIFPTRFFRENLALGEGGEEGRDNDIVRDAAAHRRERDGQEHVRRRRAEVA